LGDIKPCCVYDHKSELGNLSDNSLKEVWNNDNTKALRLKFLNGEIEPKCHHCNSREEALSARPNYNKSYFHSKRPNNVRAVNSTFPDGTVPEHNLTYMDVRFNNLCNLSCRTCGPHFSTSWIMDYRKLHTNIDHNDSINNSLQYPGNSEDHAFNEMLPHISTMENIYFAGGEPLIQSQHYQVLDKLIECGNDKCGIVYNTNISKLRLSDKYVIDYWNKLYNVFVCVSIDGSYQRAEYWRHGTVWEDVVNNIKSIKKEAPHVNVSVSFTLSWPNAINMIHLHKEWFDLELIRVHQFNINVLSGPYYYSLQNIPVWKKTQIENIYREHIEWLASKITLKNKKDIDSLINQFESAIRFMNEPILNIEQSLKEFIIVTKKLDEIRNENFFETFPEHLDMKEYLDTI
jgi:MoaA/NifB/PqqE/SkfB family radical SAM enzyme